MNITLWWSSLATALFGSSSKTADSDRGGRHSHRRPARNSHIYVSHCEWEDASLIPILPFTLETTYQKHFWFCRRLWVKVNISSLSCSFAFLYDNTTDSSRIQKKKNRPKLRIKIFLNSYKINANKITRVPWFKIKIITRHEISILKEVKI